MVQRKSGYWNIFNIAYFIIVTSCNLIFFDRINLIIFKQTPLFLLYQLIMFYDLILFFSLLLFKINYGPFGSLKRNNFPEGKIIEEFKSFGRIGFFRIGYFFSKWVIFDNGLGIKIFGIIKIFIPRNDLKIVNDHKLIHNSSEIYNPIILNRDIVEKLNDLNWPELNNW